MDPSITIKPQNHRVFYISMGYTKPHSLLIAFYNSHNIASHIYLKPIGNTHRKARARFYPPDTGLLLFEESQLNCILVEIGLRQLWGCYCGNE